MAASERLLFVCDSDSNLAFATAFAAFAAEHGVASDVAFCASQASLVVQATLARQGAAPIQVYSDWRDIFEHPDSLNYQSIFVLLTGREVPVFCDTVRRCALSFGRHRPKLIGGFIGEWISSAQQVLERASLDYFLVNRADEIPLFQQLLARNAFGCKLLYGAYPLVNRHTWRKPLQQTFEYRPDSRIVFAEQVQVPRSQDERRVLFRYLFELAERHPNGEILFCERETKLGTTRHRGIGGLTELLGETINPPANFKRVPGGFRKNLPHADVVVAISSTACIEALINGVPAVFVSGFQGSGVEKFLETGLVLELPDLLAPQTLTIEQPFFDTFSDDAAWPRVLALATERAGARTPVRDAPVMTALLPTFSSTMMARCALLEACGSHLNAIETPFSPDFDFELVNSCLAPLSPEQIQNATISSRVQIRGPEEVGQPACIQLSEEGAATLDLESANFCLHLHCPAGDLETVLVEGLCLDEPFSIVAPAKGDVMVRGAPEILAHYEEHNWPSGKERVLIMRSFHPLKLRRVEAKPRPKRPPVDSVSIEAAYCASDSHVHAPRVPAQSISFAEPGDICVMTRLSCKQGKQENIRLLVFTSKEGGEIVVDLSQEDRVAITLPGQGRQNAKQLPLQAENLLAVFMTSEVAVVMFNENVLVADAGFTQPTLKLGNRAAVAGLEINGFAAYRGTMPTYAIDRYIELVTVRLFETEENAAKHQTIPDFRSEIDADLPVSSARPAAKAAVKAARSPTSSPIVLAQAALAAGEYANAIDISEQALATTPSSTRHMWVLVEAYTKTQQIPDAIVYCRRFLAEKPAHAEARSRLQDLEDRLRTKAS